MPTARCTHKSVHPLAKVLTGLHSRRSDPPLGRTAPRGGARALTRGPLRSMHAGPVSDESFPTLPGVYVRPKSAADLDSCVRLARVVHAMDGYPPYLPDDDFAAFISSPEAIGAWVAVRGGEVAGHVAFHSRSSPAVLDLATTITALEAERLGVVARLLVAPGARRLGLGRMLLEQATSEARNRGLVSILDVSTRLDAAISLYEASGWRRLGMVSVAFPDGTQIEEFVYVEPQESG
jgi:GNAT superfamily N-acetyltransferase